MRHLILAAAICWPSSIAAAGTLEDIIRQCAADDELLASAWVADQETVRPRAAASGGRSESLVPSEGGRETNTSGTVQSPTGEPARSAKARSGSLRSNVSAGAFETNGAVQSPPQAPAPVAPRAGALLQTKYVSYQPPLPKPGQRVWVQGASPPKSQTESSGSTTHGDSWSGNHQTIPGK